ncbi:MAG TPA: hypothetical protein VMH30_13920 [Verrucomicrobiae bacterium]|nr:hypothetical protein [Verrucomicrobiae bacterium]
MICLMLGSSAHAQAANDKLLMFQKFVNGEVPIREATVYRTFSRPDGKTLVREWFRFGYQDGTWYIRRLMPDPDDPSKLVPRPDDDDTVCGASLTEFWTMTDRNIDVVDKAFASGSVPDSYGEVFRNYMFRALSLGLPRQSSVLNLEDSQIEWNGLSFKTTVTSKWGRGGTTLETAVITGELTLGDNGLPASALYPGVGQLPPGSVTYEYATPNAGIPSSFILKFDQSVYHYTFLSLTLGTDDLAQTGGYVPSMFGDMKIARMLTVWTNSLSWTLHGKKFYPDFGVNIIVPHRKLIGPFILISVAIVTGAILALWYKRTKTEQ